MLTKAIYSGCYPLGGDLKIDGIQVMQSEWKYLHRPTVLPFGKTIQGVSPMFSQAYVVEKNKKLIFFLATESGIGKYHIWCFPDVTTEKLRSHKNLQTKELL